MSAARFTPGPWKVEGDRCAFGIRYGEEGNNALACALHYASGVDADHDRAKADAHLMASAPELHAVAEAAALHFKADTYIGALARAALSKARGEA